MSLNYFLEMKIYEKKRFLDFANDYCNFDTHII